MDNEGQIIEQIKRHFQEFFENQDHGAHYIDKIRQSIIDQKYRIIININDVRNFGAELATEILNRPREHLIAIQEVITELALNSDPATAKVLKINDLQVGFDGSFGTHAVSPRGLGSSLLNKLVVVEGIVTKCSSIRPKLVRSVHYCPLTNLYTTKDYRDQTDLDIGIQVKGRERLPTTSTFPTKDVNGNPLELEQGLCQYKDYQTIVLQEMPERARVGQLPRSVELILQHDLVDRIKPGDRAQCVGIYRPLASVQNGQTQGVFRSVLMCNNVTIIGKEIGAVRLTGADVGHIREISERPDVLTILGRSFCPTIYGHEFVKKALILQLLGGCERNLENGTHLRGDINLMMVGDPSTAKSQLLRAVLDIAPLAISTTGRGSSGVGLTAAVTSDGETGERRLEAGAMVLADRGVVCIDEFDKMSENDRVAIHEVMEQQTVTIAKAGIHASLNARCSVVAAANPVYGQYDRTRRPQDNIGLPDSLLSRFDLLFIVLDQLDPTLDRTLSEHVIKSHQYRRPGSTMEPEPLDGTINLSLESTADGPKDTIVWQRGGRGSEKSIGNGSAHDVLTKEFLRKYIHYARNRVKPTLSDEAMDAISVAYADMRSKQTPKNLPITARSLETIIRLASAHAKSRLSNVVNEYDVEEVLELMNYVLFHEIGNYSSPQTVVNVHGSGTGNGNGNVSRERLIPTKRNRNSSKSGEGEMMDEDGEEYKTEEKRSKNNEDQEVEEDTLGRYIATPIDKESSRYMQVQNIVVKLGTISCGEALSFESILNRLNSDDKNKYSKEELQQILRLMEEENMVMYQDGEVHVII